MIQGGCDSAIVCADVEAMFRYALSTYDAQYAMPRYDLLRNTWDVQQEDDGTPWDYRVENLLNYDDTKQQLTSQESFVMKITTCPRLKSATLVLKVQTAHSGRNELIHPPGRTLGAVEAWVGPQADAKGHRKHTIRSF